MTTLILLLAFSLVHSISTSAKEACEVRTSYGALLGKQMTSRSGTVFCAFLGVPYAMPPTGQLRFHPPISPQTWNGVRNATEEGNICLQKGFGGSEDCLYLNVFTHCFGSNRSKTVMVYIHGGGFFMGSSSMGLLGPEYLMDKDIVLVTLQYRLGPFGFLSTEDEVVPGNMGMKDQVKALQWVQENIRAFGGNPRQVTIFGNSAGGASVHLHMQSPLSTQLFARGISQSGTAYSVFGLAGKGICKNITNQLALTLNCTIISSEEILRCLQNKTSIEVLDGYNSKLYSGYDYDKILLRPTVEKNTEHSFLTTNPRTVQTKKPWLVGVNANEGIFMVLTEKLNETLNLLKTEFSSYIPKILFFDDKYKNPVEDVKSIHKFYFENSSSTDEMIRSLEQVITDSWFVWPTRQALRQHNGSLYHYLYEHQGEHSYTEFYRCPKGFGVSHVDELIVLFGQKSLFPDLNDQDTNISKLMVNFWVNFAKEGNPTPRPISSNPQKNNSADFIWEAANSTNPQYIHIQASNLTMEGNMFSERMDFWQQLQLKDNYL